MKETLLTKINNIQKLRVKRMLHEKLNFCKDHKNVSSFYTFR